MADPDIQAINTLNSDSEPFYSIIEDIKNKRIIIKLSQEATGLYNSTDQKFRDPITKELDANFSSYHHAFGAKGLSYIIEDSAGQCTQNGKKIDLKLEEAIPSYTAKKENGVTTLTLFVRDRPESRFAFNQIRLMRDALENNKIITKLTITGDSAVTVRNQYFDEIKEIRTNKKIKNIGVTFAISLLFIISIVMTAIALLIFPPAGIPLVALIVAGAVSGLATGLSILPLVIGKDHSMQKYASQYKENAGTFQPKSPSKPQLESQPEPASTVSPLELPPLSIHIVKGDSAPGIDQGIEGSVEQAKKKEENESSSPSSSSSSKKLS